MSNSTIWQKYLVVVVIVVSVVVLLMGVVVIVIGSWWVVIIVIAPDDCSGSGEKENCTKVYSSLYNLYRAIHNLWYKFF